MTLVNPSDECMAVVYKEFDTTKERVKEDVQVLKKWLHLQPHLPHIDDDKCLEIILVRCKCSVERAKQAWDMHFTLKTALPEFFQDRDPTAPNMKETMSHLEIVPLPNVTAEGYRVTVFKILQKDAAEFQPEMFFKVGLMVADIRLKEDSSVGDVYIYDCEHITMGHISKLSLAMLKKMEVCAAQGYRARIKGVHFINASPVLDVLMTMVKSVIKSKLASRHYVHADLTSLYKHVDKDILPGDYGGQAMKLNEIGAEWKAKVDSYRGWFLDQQDSGKADESKRPGQCINTSDLFGFDGTFKQLAVD